MKPSGTVISDLRSAILEIDDGFEAVVESMESQENKNAMMSFREATIEFLVNKVDYKASGNIDLEQLSKHLFEQYLAIMIMAVS